MFLAMQWYLFNLFLLNLVVYCSLVYKSDTDSVARILRKTLKVLFAGFVWKVQAFYFIICLKCHKMNYPKVWKTKNTLFFNDS